MNAACHRRGITIAQFLQLRGHGTCTNSQSGYGKQDTPTTYVYQRTSADRAHRCSTGCRPQQALVRAQATTNAAVQAPPLPSALPQPPQLQQQQPQQQMHPLRGLYPSSQAHASGYLKVSELHSIYYELHGNSCGVPAVFIHGGPGAGCFPNHARFFDPHCYRIILLDQRGCGRSTPYGCLAQNTTADLVDDLELLRQTLGVQQWHMLGGSWGAALAIAYAQAYPHAVASLILRGVCLMRPSEIQWMYGGAAALKPLAWQQFIGLLDAKERTNPLLAYYKRLLSNDSNARQAAATAWIGWEMSVGFSNSQHMLLWNGEQWTAQQQAGQAPQQQQQQQQHAALPAPPQPVSTGAAAAAAAARQGAGTPLQHGPWFPAERSGRGSRGGSTNSCGRQPAGYPNGNGPLAGSGANHGRQPIKWPNGSSLLADYGATGEHGKSAFAGFTAGPSGPAATQHCGMESSISARNDYELQQSSTLQLTESTTCSITVRTSSSVGQKPMAAEVVSRVWSLPVQDCHSQDPGVQKLLLKGLNHRGFQANSLAQALLECHYSIHGAFLLQQPLLDHVDRIRHIPCIAVQGQIDLVCPPVTAVDLHMAWPDMELRLVPGAGHSMYDPAITHELVTATDRMRQLPAAVPQHPSTIATGKHIVNGLALTAAKSRRRR